MLHPFVKLLTGWISDKATRDIIAQCYNIRLMWSLKACHYYSLPLPCLILTDMFSSNKSFILFCQRIIFLSTKNIHYWCIESKFDTYSKDTSKNDTVDMGFISCRYYMLFHLYRIHYQEFSDHLCGKTKWSTEMGNGLRGGLSNNKKEKRKVKEWYFLNPMT